MKIKFIIIIGAVYIGCIANACAQAFGPAADAYDPLTKSGFVYSWMPQSFDLSVYTKIINEAPIQWGSIKEQYDWISIGRGEIIYDHNGRITDYQRGWTDEKFSYEYNKDGSLKSRTCGRQKHVSPVKDNSKLLFEYNKGVFPYGFSQYIYFLKDANDWKLYDVVSYQIDGWKYDDFGKFSLSGYIGELPDPSKNPISYMYAHKEENDEGIIDLYGNTLDIKYDFADIEWVDPTKVDMCKILQYNPSINSDINLITQYPNCAKSFLWSGKSSGTSKSRRVTVEYSDNYNSYILRARCCGEDSLFNDKDDYVLTHKALDDNGSYEETKVFDHKWLGFDDDGNKIPIHSILNTLKKRVIKDNQGKIISTEEDNGYWTTRYDYEYSYDPQLGVPIECALTYSVTYPDMPAYNSVVYQKYTYSDFVQIDTSDVEEITEESDMASYYSIQGIYMGTDPSLLNPGIYIKVKASSSEKILIK